MLSKVCMFYAKLIMILTHRLHFPCTFQGPLFNSPFHQHCLHQIIQVFLAKVHMYCYDIVGICLSLKWSWGGNQNTSKQFFLGTQKVSQRHYIWFPILLFRGFNFLYSLKKYIYVPMKSLGFGYYR